MDAPESAQTCQDAAGKDYRCGQAAALALSDRIGEAPIACEPRDTDRYGRTVAVCRKGSEDLNAWMVAQGHSIACRAIPRTTWRLRTPRRRPSAASGPARSRRRLTGAEASAPGGWGSRRPAARMVRSRPRQSELKRPTPAVTPSGATSPARARRSITSLAREITTEPGCP
ncbi:thermonuclease family protein [Methylobacterium sp. Leaf99]|uniref:thermonuclease family protein n=1 Tax=Methylobacterium sp. Leaf99 TaxID=1736251 RepID=UPI001FCE0DF0|nr:thermonuclease family protein [Methylobacterium sp. Leaf99]